MFYRTIFIYLIGFVLVTLVELNPVKITFKIWPEKNILTCDHSDDKKQQNKYTVLEGEQFTIVTEYKSIINHFICHHYTHKDEGFHYEDTYLKNKTTFKVEKRMGTLWNCTLLAHLDNPIMKPGVHYNGSNYAAAYCFMQIHVRQNELPQTILVNNMRVQAVRNYDTEKDIDFTAEYQYADGDVVNVTCINFLNDTTSLNDNLTMKYMMAGISSDDDTLRNISSSQMIGFETKLHSGHNNSYMICTYTERNDYTRVMLTFVLQKKPDIITVTINGMVMRPIATLPQNHYYTIDYKFAANQLINVTCEVKTNFKLFVFKEKWDFVSFEMKDQNRTVVMVFNLQPGDNKTLTCAADRITRGVAEKLDITFTVGNFPTDLYSPLKMELPSNGRVMKLYSHGDVYYIVTVYEFEKDEKLLVSCGPLEKKLGVVYLQLGDETCSGIGCNVSKTFQPLTRNSSIVCYLKEQLKENLNTTSDTVRKEARVILRERVLSTSTSSTTTSTAGAIVEPQSGISPSATTHDHNIHNPPSAPSDSPRTATDENEQRNETPGSSSNLAVIAGSAACLVIICVAIAVIVIMRLRKRKDSQGGPRNPNYESLAEPSETSIPAYPPQWDNNYAVPVDRRTDDTTYSEPCPPTDLYATPTPKHLRNNKQRPVDPTYAVLAVQQQQGKKNVFTESDDPNYSEVYANRREDCYAKVLPKNVRNQMDQENPYAYVTNEPPYANTVDPEPMYCEPGKAQGSQYANLNNSYYANSNAQEYVEPTYCEPQKRRK